MNLKLSVVIVNYNVKYFLEQCLTSVRKAIGDIPAEVFVVDNNSVDGSVQMIHEKFPEVIVMDNKVNRGFSKANNQAIRQAKGEYILVLNPDTIVENDTFNLCIDFMDKQPDAGGLGVMMVDGKGHFLPESKRGFPSPATSFYKTFGLSRLFPKSKVFSKYSLGYLDKNEIHEVDVLAGAFMMLRKSVIDKVGMFDESFFMYGEDIDLSYRIIKAGYKNYYFPRTRIIHYKGESTKKSSVNYVFTFYNAMVIFARKHLSKQNAWLYITLINLAIYFRASISIFSRFFNQVFLPILDVFLLYVGIYLIKGYWEAKVIFTGGGHYPNEFIFIALPVYIFIWLMSVFLSGGYDRPVRLLKVIQGMGIGTIVILVGYALLPESWRFSRAIILIGAAWGIIAMIGIRVVLNLLKLKSFKIGAAKNKRFIVVGEWKEVHRVSELLKKTQLLPGFIGFVSPGGQRNSYDGFVGNLGQIKDIIHIFKIDEIIFCAKDVSPQLIIDKMSELQDFQVDYKIAPEDTLSIIGSNSINTSGDLYIIDINSIVSPSNKRNKRMVDIVASLVFVPLSPLMMCIVKKPFSFVKNIFWVLFGYKTWIGYYHDKNVGIDKLPQIRQGVLHPGDVFKGRNIPAETYKKLNLIYARDYKITTDLNIIWKGFSNLGRG